MISVCFDNIVSRKIMIDAVRQIRFVKSGYFE